MLVDSGAIKSDQMDSVPQNVIMQAMGTQPAVKVAMTAVQLFRNDQFSASATKRGRFENKEWNIRANLRRQFRQRFARQVRFEELIEREQR